MDPINCTQRRSSVPTAQTWWADIFPIQTEQMRNIYYMANTFQIWKELQANFIKPKTQYTCSFMSKCIQRIHCCSPEFPSIWKTWMEQINLHRNRSKKVCAGSAKEITKQWAQNWICFTPSTWARNYIIRSTWESPSLMELAAEKFES